MGHKFHRGFTAAEKTALWDRWKRGESLKAIGRAFGKPSSSIYFLVAPVGQKIEIERRRQLSNFLVLDGRCTTSFPRLNRDNRSQALPGAAGQCNDFGAPWQYLNFLPEPQVEHSSSTSPA